MIPVPPWLHCYRHFVAGFALRLRIPASGSAPPTGTLCSCSCRCCRLFCRPRSLRDAVAATLPQSARGCPVATRVGGDLPPRFAKEHLRHASTGGVVFFVAGCGGRCCNGGVVPRNLAEIPVIPPAARSEEGGRGKTDANRSLCPCQGFHGHQKTKFRYRNIQC